MGNECLRLDNLHVAGLFVPEITENVCRCLQQLRGLFGLVLLNQLLDDKHGRLLHRDVGIVGQRELTEQQLQRVLLGAVKRSARRQE